MNGRRWAIRLGAWIAFMLIVSVMPVRAGDETCQRTPITAETPSGIAGCTLDGPTIGVASHWNGSTVAAQWCVYPWKDCGSVSIRSLDTGRVVTAAVGQFCDCLWTTDRRMVDLPRGVVDALGLSWDAGIYAVEVTPSVTLPDTSVRP